ncbi:tail fiber domain-containing protein [Halovivax gelatinilyticus]|uniref:tail fiber domain-containing protein n=1 Tax=Halovivax gelatinilyticus TaxID=2961597 RepID=UPI0020CA4764|nr:tail fiber domain-containing protein [Halovivax gelatinilyticus]
MATANDIDPDSESQVFERIEALETIVRDQQETIETLESQNEVLQTTVDEFEATDAGNDDGGAPSAVLSRRSALAGLGVAGLVGLGATSVGANGGSASGQVGTSERPLERLVTTSIDGVPTSDAFELTVEDGDEAGNIVTGHSENGVAEDAVGATIGGGGSETNPNVAEDEYATVGGGEGNEATGNFSTVGGGGSNAATQQRSTVGGGLNNEADGIRSTIAGGVNNYASDNDATIAGGNNNDATGGQSTVGGGFYNEATATNSTIGGGRYNEAGGENSTVGGGEDNKAVGENSTVGGGEDNEAGGENSTVAGGQANEASGDYSFAAGRGAWATHDGSFVFGDSSIAAVSSDGEDEARFQMEVYAPEFNETSARETKTAIEPVDPAAVLEDLTSLEVSTWEFVDRDSGRHMGPMAEDFAEIFGLGVDDGSISSTDRHGVAFAAIQGLAEKLDELVDRVESLDEQIDAVEERHGAESTTAVETDD